MLFQPGGEKVTVAFNFIRECSVVGLSGYTYHGSDWGEGTYSSYSFLTSTLDGVNGQYPVPAGLTPGKWSLVLIVQEAGWTSEAVCTQRLEVGDRTPKQCYAPVNLIPVFILVSLYLNYIFRARIPRSLMLMCVSDTSLREHRVFELEFRKLKC